MNRDMDMARELLLQIADDTVRSDEWDDKEIYHLKMLSDVGYIQGITFYDGSDRLLFGLANPQLTWTGHEFLDTIRPKSVWDKIKSVAKEKGVGLTVESATKIATGVVGAMIGS
jgi:hypothetical protein